ncbi:MAG: hypothetical protein LIR50_03705 [Bacillota bacterium]|nr:hypothetical protein [Bacillota bacterium]
MVNRIKRNLISNNVALRITTTYICLVIIFITVTIISYYLLPQGFLLKLNKQPLKNWDTSSNLAISSLQILMFNLISVAAILFGNIFSTRKNQQQSFIPLGYLAFFAIITINSITLGTWSFSVLTNEIPSLTNRIVGTFDLFHRAGLWEMSGQLLILCATVKISLIITDGRKTITKNWKTVKLSKQEILLIVIGLILMLIGAIIESYGIINLN